MVARIVFFGLMLLAVTATQGLAAAANCTSCHKAEDFRGPVVHKPVAEKGCTGCHNPHVSRYGSLLYEKQPDLCYRCHEGVKKKLASVKNLHEPVKKGNCTDCHSPHKADEQALLKNKVPGLCFGCHKGLKDQKLSHTHKPFSDGQCLACHTTHGSDAPGMLKGDDPGLCLKCHSENEGTRKAHLGKNMHDLKCLGCHHGHGSPNRGLIRTYRHAPFANKECGTCHEAKDKGPALCLSCHNGVEETFNYSHNHMVPGYRNVCLACHNPHTADDEKMMNGVGFQACTSCHGDTYRRQADELHSHPKWYQICGACHQAHGSNHIGLLKDDGNKICEKCHETQGKFVHPIGEKVVDPRNGQVVTCVTCHNTHGTAFKYNLRLSGEKDLCVQCHKTY